MILAIQLADQCPASGDFFLQACISHWECEVDACSKDCDRRAIRIERGPMRSGIDAGRQAADYARTCARR